MTQEQSFIVTRSFELLGCSFQGDLKIEETDGVSVTLANGGAVIGCHSMNTLARGCFLLAKALAEGKTEYSVHQTEQIKSCGVMLDVSRKAVMRPEKVKQWIEKIALLGLNLLMLYTEEVYEIDNRPMFGYLRGRYTKEELRDIVAYGKRWGVELVPCIQTLAHLGQFLHWEGNEDIRDTGDCLMVDEPKTYELIEDMIRTCREVFETDRIHVGMDETFGLGQQNYLKKFGPQNKMDLFTRHLQRVRKICEKYSFRPMIWGDMFFRFTSKITEYVDFDVEIAPEIAAKSEGVDIVYWNFCHTDQSCHDQMMEKHKVFPGETIYAAGIWTWKGFLPRRSYSFESSIAGLKSSLKYGIQTVFAPMWNDSGMANHALALSELAIYSEMMFCGEDATIEQMESAGAFLTGVPLDLSKAINYYFYENCGQPICFDEATGSYYFISGDPFFFCDPFYPLTIGAQQYYDELKQRYDQALRLTEQHPDHPVAQYIRPLYQVIFDKVELAQRLRPAYLKQDKAELEQLLALMKQILDNSRTFISLFEQRYLEDYKPFGLEASQLKFGMVIYRMEYAIRTLSAFLDGTLDKIEELDPEPVPFKLGEFFNQWISPAI